jgi:hypothetical protein
VSRPRGVEQEDCVRCAELEAGFRDPSTVNPGAYLYGWATHHLDDHAAKPEPLPDCPECRKFAAGPGAIHSRVWERWALTHYMQCQLVPYWKPQQS